MWPAHQVLGLGGSGGVGDNADAECPRVAAWLVGLVAIPWLLMNFSAWWVHVASMWSHLTQAQATLLASLGVLTAGLLAFSTGWFDRHTQQRRHHYEEVKAAYRDALYLAMFFAGVDTMDESKDSLKMVRANVDRLRSVAVQLQLTGDYETAAMA